MAEEPVDDHSQGHSSPLTTVLSYLITPAYISKVPNSCFFDKSPELGVSILKLSFHHFILKTNFYWVFVCFQFWAEAESVAPASFP